MLRGAQSGMPYQVSPLVDESYSQQRLVCQAWRTLDLQCFAHVRASQPPSRCLSFYTLLM